MCYADPGPRCSPHAEPAWEAAKTIVLPSLGGSSGGGGSVSGSGGALSGDN